MVKRKAKNGIYLALLFFLYFWPKPDLLSGHWYFLWYLFYACRDCCDLSLHLRSNRHNLMLSIIAKPSLPSEYIGHIQTLCAALLCPCKFLNWEILPSCWLFLDRIMLGSSSRHSNWLVHQFKSTVSPCPYLSIA